MEQAKIVQLAQKIAENTSKVSSYLAANNLPQPSFEVDGPLKSSIPPEATDIEAARNEVIEATEELRNLMLGPFDYITEYTHDELISMQAVARFGMATSFPIGKEATFAEIGRACNLSESDTRRFLRHAVLKNIFKEPKPGVVAHNAVSRLLAESPMLVDFVRTSSDDLWQGASQTLNAMEKWPGSEEPNEAGFNLANNTDKSVYVYFNDHPEKAQRFGSSMTLFTEGAPFDPHHTVDGYPWGDLGESATVVDIGGSHGTICAAIAQKHPKMNFIVQELEPVVASAPKLDPSIADRVKFQAYDFFDEQPVKGADAYLFRWIFHNWSDKYTIKMIRNLIPALKPGARLIINDNVMPPPGVMPKWREERLRSMDITMKELQNAKEREVDEWKAVIEQADPRFKFKGATAPPGAALWFMEAVWEP